MIKTVVINGRQFMETILVWRTLIVNRKQVGLSLGSCAEQPRWLACEPPKEQAKHNPWASFSCCFLNSVMLQSAKAARWAIYPSTARIIE